MLPCLGLPGPWGPLDTIFQKMPGGAPEAQKQRDKTAEALRCLVWGSLGTLGRPFFENHPEAQKHKNVFGWIFVTT